MFQINDRTTQGFIAGMIGAFPQMIFSFSMYGLKIIKFRYLDFASALAFNHHPTTIFQTVVAEVIVYVFTGFLGAVFALALKTVSHENLLFKSTFYGVMGWFLIYAMVAFFRVPPLYPIGFATSVVHLIGGGIWGFALGCGFFFLNRRYGLKN